MNLEFRSLEPISCKGEVAMSSKGNDSGIAAIGDFEPTADLSRNGVEEISSDLRRLLADVFFVGNSTRSLIGPFSLRDKQLRKRRKHANDHNERWDADLLQGLGQRSAHRV